MIYDRIVSAIRQREQKVNYSFKYDNLMKNFKNLDHIRKRQPIVC